jgi:hypothetical protein
MNFFKIYFLTEPLLKPALLVEAVSGRHGA